MKRIIQAESIDATQITEGGEEITGGGGGGGGGLLFKSEVTRSGSSNDLLGVTNAKIPFNVIVDETEASFDIVNSKWVIPAGIPANSLAFVTSANLFDGTNNNYCFIKLNGTDYKYGSTADSGRPGVSHIPVTVSPGDEIEIWALRAGGGNINWDGGPTINWAILTIMGEAGGGGSAVKFSEVTMTATNVSTGATPAPVILDTIVEESEAMYNVATGEWTIPTVSGTKIAKLNYQIETSESTAKWGVLYKNGTIEKYFHYRQTGSPNVSGEISCRVETGDVLKLGIHASGGIAQTVNQAGSQFTWAVLTIG